MLSKVGMNLVYGDIEVKSSDKRVEEKKDELLNNNSVKENEKIFKFIEEQNKPVVTNYRALWVIDEKNNVLIRIEDDKGNVIKQIPPEEIINLREKINELMKKFFKIEA